jgi:hypothetical protein
MPDTALPIAATPRHQYMHWLACSCTMHTPITHLHVSPQPTAQLPPHTITPTHTAAPSASLQGLRRSKFRLVWDWGRYLYRWSAMAYSMVQLYEHPWLVRVAVSAIWASSKMALGVLM